MSKPLKISEEAAVQMPMKTVASLIIIVALGTMGYFQMIERLNVADTRLQIMEKDLNENPLAKELFKRFLRPAGARIQLLFWNQYSKRAMSNMFGGIAVFAYMIPTAAALATLIAAWFGIPLEVAIQIAKGIFYVGMTLGAAFIALMGRRAALKFINFVNKGKIDKDIKKILYYPDLICS